MEQQLLHQSRAKDLDYVLNGVQEELVGDRFRYGLEVNSRPRLSRFVDTMFGVAIAIKLLSGGSYISPLPPVIYSGGEIYYIDDSTFHRYGARDLSCWSGSPGSFQVVSDIGDRLLGVQLGGYSVTCERAVQSGIGYGPYQAWTSAEYVPGPDDNH